MTANIISKLKDVIQIIFHPKGSFTYLSKPYSSIASFHIIRQLNNHLLDLKTIIDIGANKGQFAFAASRFYPGTSIYSFEPVPDTFAKLLSNTQNMPTIYAFQYGLGSSNGEINFYQNAHSHASSALPVSDFQKSEIPVTSQTKRIKVPIRRLDDVVNEWSTNLSKPILLKLDVQGYEMEVLKGAPEFIKQVDYLLFEASFVSMYEGEPLFEEMHDYVRSLGFVLVGPVGSLQTDKEQIVQMDMLYRRR